MNDSYFYLFSSFLRPDVVERMGDGGANWLWLWMINQAQYQERDLPDEKRSFTFEWSAKQAARDLGVRRQTIYVWHETLIEGGFVTSERGQYGYHSRLIGWVTIQQWLDQRECNEVSDVSTREHLKTPDVSGSAHLNPPDVSTREHLKTPDVRSDVRELKVNSQSLPIGPKAVLKQGTKEPDVSESEHLRHIWQQTLDALQGTMTQTTFNNWFPSTELLALSESEALILCKNPYQRDWLRNRLADPVARELGSVLERPVTVYFVMSGDAVG